MIDENTLYGTPPPSEERSHQHGFSHGDGTGRNSGDGVSSTTRYLSGAPYIDEKYAELVIDELVGASRRAVAPSLGYDVTTVIRHCFRAQRLWLAQNAVITVVLVAGTVLLTSATLTFYAFCLAGHFFLPEAGRRAKWPARRKAVVALVVLVAAGCLLGRLSGSFGPGAFDSTTFGTDLGSYRYDDSEPSGGATADGVAQFLAGLVAVALAVFVALFWSRHRMITTITTDLGRGRAARPARPESREVEERLQVIAGAQHGNIVLHAGFEPFIGAGQRVNAWSIATELRPDDAAGGQGSPDGGTAAPGGAARMTGAPRRVEIDPVELVDHLRQRLAALRSRDLPARERITGLRLRDQLISSGTRWHDYPLIDDRVRLPYSFAAPEALQSIIRSPQTNARHFLRASVGAADQAAVGADGRTIMPAEHQSVVTSAYLHVAVEGGMLYVELVATVLGPIRQQYLNIDRYGGGADRLAVAAGEARHLFVHDTAVAPVRLARSLVRACTLNRSVRRAGYEAVAEPVYDFGARLDVREAAARDDCANYLQQLDAAKYTRLIDRRAVQAIDEFLTAKGVDTSDFTAKANSIQYNNTTIAGSVHGPIATGTGAAATMTAAAAGRAKGSSS